MPGCFAALQAGYFVCCSRGFDYRSFYAIGIIERGMCRIKCYDGRKRKKAYFNVVLWSIGRGSEESGGDMDTGRKYALGEDGRFDELYLMLNCIEKIKYYILRPVLGEKCWKLFLDDINMEFDDEKRLFRVASFGMGKEFFQVDRYEIQEPKQFEQIDLLLKEHEIIGIQTRFELLEPYTWEEADGPHTGHIMPVVGKDNNYYYFVEHNEIVDEEKIKRFGANREICMLPVREMERALRELCALYVFKVRRENLNFNHQDRINRMLEKIAARYRGLEQCNTENRKSFYGEKALQKMLYRLEYDTEECWEQAFLSHWDTHLMMARRIILLRNLEMCEGVKGKEELQECLRASIEAWNKMKMVLIKNNVKRLEGVQERMARLMRNIICKEKELFCCFEYGRK